MITERMQELAGMAINESYLDKIRKDKRLGSRTIPGAVEGMKKMAIEGLKKVSKDISIWTVDVYEGTGSAFGINFSYFVNKKWGEITLHVDLDGRLFYSTDGDAIRFTKKSWEKISSDKEFWSIIKMIDSGLQGE